MPTRKQRRSAEVRRIQRGLRGRLTSISSNFRGKRERRSRKLRRPYHELKPTFETSTVGRTASEDPAIERTTGNRLAHLSYQIRALIYLTHHALFARL